MATVERWLDAIIQYDIDLSTYPPFAVKNRAHNVGPYGPGLSRLWSGRAHDIRDALLLLLLFAAGSEKGGQTTVQ